MASEPSAPDNAVLNAITVGVPIAVIVTLPSRGQEPYFERLVYVISTPFHSGTEPKLR